MQSGSRQLPSKDNDRASSLDLMYSVSSSNGRCSGSNLVRGSAGLDLGLLSQAHDSVSSVQGGSNLLVGLNEALELDVQVLVLALEDGAVLVNCITFSFNVIVSFQEILVVESEILLFFSGDHQVVLGVPEFSFSFENV